MLLHEINDNVLRERGGEVSRLDEDGLRLVEDDGGALSL